MISFHEPPGVWWPDYDKHCVEGHRWVLRRITDLELTARACKRRAFVIQAGGHIGLWPIRLAQHFQTVVTFEPEPALFECLKRNVAKVAPKSDIRPMGVALGAFAGPVMMSSVGTAGSSRVWEKGTIPVNQVTIDQYEFPRVDAIILDIEGGEVDALKGATETIKKWRPILHVEELPRVKVAIRAHMASLRYVPFRTVHGDTLYRPL